MPRTALKMADPPGSMEVPIPSSKEGKFRPTHDDKFECLVCGEKLATKHSVLRHLHTIHGFTPIRRKKKRYVDDDSVAIPRTTLHRWKKSRTESSKAQKSLAFDKVPSESHENFNNSFSSDKQMVGASGSAAESMSSSCIDFHVNSVAVVSGVKNFVCDNPSDDDCNNFDILSDTEQQAILLDSDVTNDKSLSGDDSSVNVNYSSCSSVFSESSSSDVSNIEESSVNLITHHSHQSVQEAQALTILSCFLRNNLSTAACKDILGTMKSLFPDSSSLEMLDFGQILSYVDSAPIQEIHYCVLCSELFPNDVDMFRCSNGNCTGLRYKGHLSMQMKKGRQPRQCFVFADVKRQLKSLLQSPGIWKDIQKHKEATSCRNPDVISDVVDGSCYRQMYKDGGFMTTNHGRNLTAVFNTDGVNLYSSSKIELWPIFLAINEISPELRFARENMLLVGIWRWKGKPPFRQYMQCFAEEMNSLYYEGIDLTSGNGEVNVKLAVTCGIADLPAKAGLLNMTMFNGCNACITCEEPGIQVKQGKGTSRCFPYREEEDRHQMRSSESVLTCMESGTDKNRIKGFRGSSGLNALCSFDLVRGMVPDYMHGILLGIVKTLLNKWFAPSSSGNAYFLGKNIKEISTRLQTIKPPMAIERLPRNLEKHFANLKATELQAWLLFYALPCLNGILQDSYMLNLACLSEGVYLLLGDSISTEELDRAEVLLDTFYSSFIELYGQGSCGLNVHNAGAHLVQYVRMWGPLWSWSCFPFEDANAMLLQAVHGTGIVLKQVMRYRQAQSCIRQKGILPESNTWKVSIKADNCSCAGAPKKFNPGDLEETIMEELQEVQVENLSDVSKVDRVVIHGKRFYAKCYSRMQKRECSVVLFEENCINKIGSIQYFVHVKKSNMVYAIVGPYQPRQEDGIFAKHLIPVETTQMPSQLVGLDALIDTLVFIKPYDSSSTKAFVANLPNRHGHSIFK